MQDTIYALATGGSASAVAVIRVSGPCAADIGRRFCSVQLQPRHAHYCDIRDPLGGDLIDSGLVLFFKSPASFTGEDSLEFQVHGSRAVVRRLLQCLGREAGTRMAAPGEFIRRAFEHGKIALTSVEGIADLIEANTDLQRRQALSQAGGLLARRAERWREMLLEALALVTAEIDFSDEGEAPSHVADQVLAIVATLRSELTEALQDAQRGEVVRNGFRVVLCGLPNAGKSTLLNTLAQREVAIVTEHAGTTRDLIEVQLDLGGMPVTLLDTAGLRTSADPVEAIGIERTRAAMDDADLLVWLAGVDDAPPAFLLDHTRCVLVATKSDLSSSTPGWADLAVSAHSGNGISELISLVSDRAGDAMRGEPPLVTSARQRHCVEVAVRQLDQIRCGPADLEFLADGLLRSSDSLQALVGRIGVEEVLGSLFARFCMGK